MKSTPFVISVRRVRMHFERSVFVVVILQQDYDLVSMGTANVDK